MTGTPDTQLTDPTAGPTPGSSAGHQQHPPAPSGNLPGSRPPGDTDREPESADRDGSTPTALSKWIAGTMQLHFAGTTVKRHMSLADARGMSEMVDSKRSSDDLSWSHLGFIQFASKKVLAAEFEADEDLGWRLTPEERAAYTKVGLRYRHGLLKALVEFWRGDAREPSYSINALAALNRFVLEGTPEIELEAWMKRLEGKTGADLIERAIAQVERNGNRSTDPGRAFRRDPEGHASSTPEPQVARAQSPSGSEPRPAAGAPPDLEADDTAEPEDAADSGPSPNSPAYAPDSAADETASTQDDEGDADEKGGDSETP